MLLNTCMGGGGNFALQAGYDVLGAYMSPVHDAYTKKGLAPVHHRIAMCQLAAQTSPLIMVGSVPVPTLYFHFFCSAATALCQKGGACRRGHALHMEPRII